MYRHVIEPIARAGYYVIVPDYRGAGESSIPPDGKGGYDKFTMAQDIHSLYKENLGVEKAYIVGIDIGSMVATALTLQFRTDVLALYASGEFVSVYKKTFMPL